LCLRRTVSWFALLRVRSAGTSSPQSSDLVLAPPVAWDRSKTTGRHHGPLTNWQPMSSTLLGEDVLRWVAVLVTSVLAAYIGSALTLRRVKREKRWDARHEAYKSMLRSLHDIRFWADETYADANLLPSVGTQKREELGKRFDNAKHELWAHVHVGQLAVSPHCRESLDALLSSIATEEHRFEHDQRGDEEYPEDLAKHCDNLRNLIDTALPEIVAAAVKDLA
jgi:hypothetical protein